MTKKNGKRNDTAEPFWRTMGLDQLDGMTVTVSTADGSDVTGRLDTGGKGDWYARIRLGGGQTVNVFDKRKPRKPCDGILSIGRADGTDGGDLVAVQDMTEARIGDIAVSKSGNKYQVLEDYDPAELTLLVEADGETIRSTLSRFSHLLRRRGHAPTHPGLWWEKGGRRLWLVEETFDGELCLAPLMDEAGEWSLGDPRMMEVEELETLGDFHECAVPEPDSR